MTSKTNGGQDAASSLAATGAGDEGKSKAVKKTVRDQNPDKDKTASQASK